MNLIKPNKKSIVNVDSDDEIIYEQRMPSEYEQIGILDQTQIIDTLKERMEEIDFLIYYFTGKQSKKKKHKVGKKVFKEESEQDKIDDQLRYNQISKDFRFYRGCFNWIGL